MESSIDFKSERLILVKSRRVIIRLIKTHQQFFKNRALKEIRTLIEKDRS